MLRSNPHSNRPHLNHNAFLRISGTGSRRGFATLLLVMFLISALTVLGVLTVRAVVDSRRHWVRTSARYQLDCAVVAADQWVRGGGQLQPQGATELEFPLPGESQRWQVTLTRTSPAVIAGSATVFAGDKLVGTTTFTIPYFSPPAEVDSP